MRSFDSFIHMTDLLLVHRPVSGNGKESLGEENSSILVWKTCLRQIFFLDRNDPVHFEFGPTDEVYVDLEADTFLAEVLCGLKSPLIGETEVLGQFRAWWKALPDHLMWKKKFQGRIEALLSLVKGVREKVLYGQGSQSYGSLLRRHLQEARTVDLIGAGHLVQEMIPWIESKTDFRVWCRDPEKVAAHPVTGKAREVLPLNELKELSPLIVVAAPLPDQELNQWLYHRGFSEEHHFFDLRSESAQFRPTIQPRLHLKLQDFSSQFDQHRSEIEKKAMDARHMIINWKETQVSKMQIRPFGWDDIA